MGETKLAGNPIGLYGDFPVAGAQLENFCAVQQDLSPFALEDYKDGPLTGLTARAVIVLSENNEVIFAQLVDDITNEPDYEAAIAVL